MSGLCDKKRHFEFGTNNPTTMEKPFWKYMVANAHLSAFAAREEIKKAEESVCFDKPIWCFARFGATHTYLPDERLVCIGGEHEDHYDPDFQIYNDVVVIRNPRMVENYAMYVTPIPLNFPGPKNSGMMLGTSNVHDVTIYGYPEDVFPPIDFHTATYVQNKDKEEFIYIIGGLGHIDSPHRKETHVYRLRVSDFTIEEIRTSGIKPVGCTNSHCSKLVRVEGHQIIKIEMPKEQKYYQFDVEAAKWL